MHKKLAFTIAVVCVLAFAGSAIAVVPSWWNANTDCVIHYDGYLQMDSVITTDIWADTLIVVNNTSLGAAMNVEIDVFDKYGNPVANNELLKDGGSQITSVPASGFGWTTLALLTVGRSTGSPYEPGDRRAEKLSFRIWAQRPSGLMPVVEVKQFVYSTYYSCPLFCSPYYGPWEPSLFSNWSETALGGKAGTGVIWP